MAEKKRVEATLQAYEPTLREKIYQAVAGTEQRPSADRMNFARGIADLAEFVPGLGNVLLGQEAARRGDTKGMLMAALPLPGAARGKAALGALEKRALESFRPMNAFERNTYSASTGGRPYIPEMAVTDAEMYGPFSREGATMGQGRNTGFDQNIYQAYLRGRFARGGGPVVGEGGEGTARMMGMGYSAEDLGQAVAPYRQGGLVYEPVGRAGGPRMIEGPRMGTSLAYGRGPIEGEFTDVYGIGGPRGAMTPSYGRGPLEGEFSDVYGIPQGMGYRPNFTMEGAPYTPAESPPMPNMAQRMGAGAYQYEPSPANMAFGVARDGMAAAPSGMMFDPRVAAGAAGLGYLAGLPRERETVAQAGGRPVDLTFNPDIPVPIDRGVYSKSGLGPVLPQTMESYSGIQPTYHNPSTYEAPMPPSGATALSGQAPGAGTAFRPKTERAPAKAKGGAAKGSAKGKSAPLTPRREQEAAAGFEPNFNYLVTQAIDRLLGQHEAERGREFQQYYERNPL